MNELDKLQGYLERKGYSVKRVDKVRASKYGNRAQKRGEEWADFGTKHEIWASISDKNIRFTAICSWGSLGFRKGLIELTGPSSIMHPKNEYDGFEGWLTAQEIIDRLEAL